MDSENCHENITDGDVYDEYDNNAIQLDDSVPDCCKKDDSVPD
jgi:hypothetical protein